MGHGQMGKHNFVPVRQSIKPLQQFLCAAVSVCHQDEQIIPVDPLFSALPCVLCILSGFIMHEMQGDVL